VAEDARAHAAWFNLGAEWTKAAKPERDPRLSYRDSRCAPISRPPRSISAAARGAGVNLSRRSPVGREALQTDAHRIVLLNSAPPTGNNSASSPTRGSDAGQPDIDRDRPTSSNTGARPPTLCLWLILSDAIHGLSADDLMESAARSRAGANGDQVAVQAHIAGDWISGRCRRRGASGAPEGTGRPHPPRLSVLGFSVTP